DHVVAVTVDEHRDGLPTKVIASTAGKCEAFARQIAHRRRKVQARREPWLHRVLIGRRDLGEMTAERSANMCSHGLGGEVFAVAPLEDGRPDKPGEHRRGASAQSSTQEPAPALAGSASGN